jgi:hypothetical protein
MQKGPGKYNEKRYPYWTSNRNIQDGSIIGWLCYNCKNRLKYNKRFTTKAEINKYVSELFSKSRKGIGNPYYGMKKSPEVIEKTASKLRGRIRKRGHEATNWKGGKTPVIIAIRSSAMYNQWRFAIYKRDKNKCQSMWCKNPSPGLKDLVAHHITPLALLVHVYGINSIEDIYNYPILWDVKNGLTLCKICHERTSSYKWNFAKNYHLESASSRRTFSNKLV